ncbi:MAG: hypothetical protein HKN87_05310 [Saprospiraceae bacterium]|nr:hypothetical protein [Saprospiraceae bacterium]
MIATRLWLLLLFSGYLISACHIIECGPDKDAFLKKYDHLIEEVSDIDAESAAGDWAAYDERFTTYIESCYDIHAANMSAGEKRQFWVHSLTYYSLRYEEEMINILMDEDNTTSSKIRRQVEAVAAESGLALEAFLEKNAKELEKILLDFGSDLGLWLEGLKDIIQDQ